jgi:RNA polymerase sigma-70 factor (ECF subfamily)
MCQKSCRGARFCAMMDRNCSLSSVTFGRVDRLLGRMSQSEPAGTSETELIARSIDGDTGAFGALYERYLDAIYRYVYYSVPDHAEAEDLTESIFFKAWQALPRFHLQGPGFRTWLYRIARNTIIDRHRTHKRTTSLEEAVLLRDPAPTPQAVVEADQEVSRLSVALSRLKPRPRQVILCRFISGLSHTETAAVLGISEGYVRVLQHRALKRMRLLLAEDMGENVQVKG